MFEPTFIHIHDLKECAQIINAPHEPKAQHHTEEIICLISVKYTNVGSAQIGEHLIRSVHQYICRSWMRNAGTYRNIPVSIGGNVLQPHPVPQQMFNLHPYRIDTEEDLKEWYHLFQEVHPFEDGNGRVGGAIIAGISYALFGYYLTPVEE